MLHNLTAFLAFVVCAYGGYRLWRQLLATAGQHRAGRFAAYVIGAMCYGLGIGLLGSFAGDGWHRTRYGEWVHTGLLEGIALGGVLGLLGGIVLFVQNELRGPPYVRAPEQTPEFPPSYVEGILAVEPTAPLSDRRKMAQHLLKRSTKTGQQLPPELAAFVERANGDPRLR